MSIVNNVRKTESVTFRITKDQKAQLRKWYADNKPGFTCHSFTDFVLLSVERANETVPESN